MNNNVSLSPRTIVLILGAMAFFLVIAGLAGQLTPNLTGHGEVVTLFNFNSERNIPAFFSTLLILGATLLLAVIAVFKRAGGAAYTVYWVILACGFMFMAVDEAMSLHEKLNEPMSWLLGKERAGIFYFPWVFAGIGIVIVLGLVFLRFLLHLPVKTRLLFLAAAALYLGGAIVVELLGNHFAAVHGTKSWRFVVSGAIEEGLEMAGMIVFIFALLKYIAEFYGEVRFRFQGPDDDTSGRRRFPSTVNPVGAGSSLERRHIR
ncbi:MAG TPA: hypothetical protein VF268_16640 [Gammaproteobacteria bacterium]